MAQSMESGMVEADAQPSFSVTVLPGIKEDAIEPELAGAGLLLSVNAHIQAPLVIPRLMSQDLLILLDRSSSMAGTKLEKAKAAVSIIAKRLMDPRDRLSVVPFGSTVDPTLVWPLQPVSDDAEGFDAYLRGIEAGGGTNIFEAVRTAIYSLPRAGDSEAKFNVRSMIILTDGQCQRPRPVATFKALFNSGGCSGGLHTLGIGEDCCQASLASLAHACGGQFHYLRESDALGDQVRASLANLFGSLSSTCMRRVKLEAEPLVPGVQLQLQGNFKQTNRLMAERHSEDVVTLLDVDVGDMVARQSLTIPLVLALDHAYHGPTNVAKLTLRFQYADSGLEETIVRHVAVAPSMLHDLHTRSLRLLGLRAPESEKRARVIVDFVRGSVFASSPPERATSSNPKPSRTKRPLAHGSQVPLPIVAVAGPSARVDVEEAAMDVLFETTEEGGSATLALPPHTMLQLHGRSAVGVQASVDGHAVIRVREGSATVQTQNATLTLTTQSGAMLVDVAQTRAQNARQAEDADKADKGPKADALAIVNISLVAPPAMPPPPPSRGKPPTKPTDVPATDSANRPQDAVVTSLAGSVTIHPPSHTTDGIPPTVTLPPRSACSIDLTGKHDGPSAVLGPFASAAQGHWDEDDGLALPPHVLQCKLVQDACASALSANRAAALQAIQHCIPTALRVHGYLIARTPTTAVLHQQLAMVAEAKRAIESSLPMLLEDMLPLHAEGAKDQVSALERAPNKVLLQKLTRLQDVLEQAVGSVGQANARDDIIHAQALARQTAQEIDQGRDVWGSGTNEGHGEWQDDPNENPYQRIMRLVLEGDTRLLAKQDLGTIKAVNDMIKRARSLALESEKQSFMDRVRGEMGRTVSERRQLWEKRLSSSSSSTSSTPTLPSPSRWVPALFRRSSTLGSDSGTPANVNEALNNQTPSSPARTNPNNTSAPSTPVRGPSKFLSSLPSPKTLLSASLGRSPRTPKQNKAAGEEKAGANA